MLYTFRRMFLHRFLSVCILELQLHSKSLRFHRFNKNISIIHLENIIPRVQKLPQSCLKITQTYHPFTHHRALSEQSRETNHDDLCTLRKKMVFRCRRRHALYRTFLGRKIGAGFLSGRFSAVFPIS